MNSAKTLHVSRFGITTLTGDEYIVTLTERADGYHVDACLPNGYWGEGEHTMRDILVGPAAPTAPDIQRAIEDHVTQIIDAAWFGVDTTS